MAPPPCPAAEHDVLLGNSVIGNDIGLYGQAMVDTLIPLVVAVAVIVVAPGPNVIAVTMSSVRDRRRGLWTAVGVSTGDVVWATAALAGLGAMLGHSRPVFMAFKWVGAVYLVFLAVRLWRATPNPTSAAEPPVRSGRRPFVNGLLVDLANPKAAVFFTSLYASLVPPTSTCGPRRST
ncbi:MAG: LysE family translocator [Acidimicrobiales bacterium]